MEKPLYNTIIPVIITCMISFSEVFSQESPQESAVLISENIQPNYHYEYIPDFTYEEVNRRIKAMDTEMPFALNDRIFSFIQYFTVRNRDYTKMVLARKDKFFPLFEETLKKHEMPSEIEYLSIVESGLDPQIKSRVGAMGLWQFMPATGKMYGMNVNSDVDDRMDPELSTDAAAKYLKSLYRMFGDWEVAMAAYNCGPGNVRKAIRKSGGKTTFWGIYDHLPKETRSYVPQVQAFLYVLNHLEEHNFNLEEPTYPIEYDKIRFDRALNLGKLAALTDICLKELEELNPSVKNGSIPLSNRSMEVKIPKSRAIFIKENLAWISDSLGNQPTFLLTSNTPHAIIPVEKAVANSNSGRIAYQVKSGDVLGSIASKHGVSVTQVKEWNNLSSNLIKVGQTLYIHSGKAGTAPTLADNSKSTEQRTYTVRPGDSLWIISQKHALSIEQIKRLNNLNSNNIKPGQKLIIG
ncbi:membrane-bound lytic murein transglycosylase D [Algoriphagus alkaliphilus]|uniref:Membrane-bound lytic murein transglycosylase D n=1 Tax=Algoriphagus alkaliphilus TaxID=279824 RepID=A0A1G5VPQ3_9BACT|nr:LysM peptidoglycan-binding domain-containing protein [Algoriphagus alkaliphilus]SDA47025.1 membrane-bound lytic murein transglycosylase D [Algoriphagus alkaliphilus]